MIFRKKCSNFQKIKFSIFFILQWFLKKLKFWYPPSKNSVYASVVHYINIESIESSGSVYVNFKHYEKICEFNMLIAKLISKGILYGIVNENI